MPDKRKMLQRAMDAFEDGVAGIHDVVMILMLSSRSMRRRPCPSRNGRRRIGRIGRIGSIGVPVIIEDGRSVIYGG